MNRENKKGIDRRRGEDDSWVTWTKGC